MHGAEYQTHTYSNSRVHGRLELDIPCAVCHVSNRTAVYMPYRMDQRVLWILDG